MKNVLCPVCTSINQYEILYPDTLGDDYPVFGYNSSPEQVRSYQIVKCKRCGHGFASPIPDNMYKNYVDVIDNDYLRTSQLRTMTAEKVIFKIREFKRKGTLLDIGCSTGEFLDVSKKHYTSEGMELSKWASDIAIEKGHKLYKNIDELDGRNYDIITLFGVIEHIENPRKYICSLKPHLNEGGIVCMWTGNLDGVMSKLLKNKWYYIQGQHIQYFTSLSLDGLMLSKGFYPVYSGTYPYVMDMNYISKSLERYELSKFIRPLLLRFGEIKLTLKLPGEMFKIYKKLSKR